ncbi:hypothetical protein ACET3Z_003759 [Daucus carota]
MILYSPALFSRKVLRDWLLLLPVHKHNNLASNLRNRIEVCHPGRDGMVVARIIKEYTKKWWKSHLYICVPTKD